MNDDIKARIEKLIGGGLQCSAAMGYAAREHNYDWQDWRTQLIDRLAKDAKVLYGDDAQGFFGVYDTSCMYSVLTLDIQPIKRGVTKKEIVALLRSVAGNSLIADRIEREGIVE